MKYLKYCLPLLFPLLVIACGRTDYEDMYKNVPQELPEEYSPPNEVDTFFWALTYKNKEFFAYTSEYELSISNEMRVLKVIDLNAKDKVEHDFASIMYIEAHVPEIEVDSIAGTYTDSYIVTSPNYSSYTLAQHHSFDVIKCLETDTIISVRQLQIACEEGYCLFLKKIPPRNVYDGKDKVN